MRKRLIVCADGTWNSVEKARGGKHVSTNVAKLAAAIQAQGDDGAQQFVCYLQGVGTSRNEWLRGGMFGFGISRNIAKGYEFLVRNYAPGDEIWLFGFSRGAFTARSLGGMIRNCGVLTQDDADQLGAAMALYRDRYDDTAPDAPRARIFRNTYSHEPNIKFIGVWDTVGSLGVPGIHQWLARLLKVDWQFHDTELSKIVENAYQALAIHERRCDFRPTLWQKRDTVEAAKQTLQQVWFTGVHSDVGGGYVESGLSDVPFLWMVDRAKAQGLTFRDDFLQDRRWVDPDPQQAPHDSFDFPFSWLDTLRRQKGDREFRPKKNTFESIHPTALAQRGSRPDQLPPSFRQHSEIGETERSGSPAL